MDLQRVSVDTGRAVLPSLPGTPPVAGEVEFVADLPGELGDRDAQGVGQGHGSGENGLLLARLVARELPEADAGRLGQLGLRQAECESPRPDDLGDVHGGMVTDVTGI